MSQNLQKTSLESITIKDYLEEMLQEESISLKILSKGSFKLYFYFILLQISPKHVPPQKDLLIKPFSVAKHAHLLNQLEFVLDAIFPVI